MRPPSRCWSPQATTGRRSAAPVTTMAPSCRQSQFSVRLLPMLLMVGCCSAQMLKDGLRKSDVDSTKADFSGNDIPLSQYDAKRELQDATILPPEDDSETERQANAIPSPQGNVKRERQDNDIPSLQGDGNGERQDRVIPSTQGHAKPELHDNAIPSPQGNVKRERQDNGIPSLPDDGNGERQDRVIPSTQGHAKPELHDNAILSPQADTKPERQDNANSARDLFTPRKDDGLARVQGASHSQGTTRIARSTKEQIARSETATGVGSPGTRVVRSTKEATTPAAKDYAVLGVGLGTTSAEDQVITSREEGTASEEASASNNGTGTQATSRNETTSTETTATIPTTATEPTTAPELLPPVQALVECSMKLNREYEPWMALPVTNQWQQFAKHFNTELSTMLAATLGDKLISVEVTALHKGSVKVFTDVALETNQTNTSMVDTEALASFLQSLLQVTDIGDLEFDPSFSTADASTIQLLVPVTTPAPTESPFDSSYVQFVMRAPNANYTEELNDTTSAAFDELNTSVDRGMKEMLIKKFPPGEWNVSATLVNAWNHTDFGIGFRFIARVQPQYKNTTEIVANLGKFYVYFNRFGGLQIDPESLRIDDMTKYAPGLGMVVMNDVYLRELRESIFNGSYVGDYTTARPTLRPVVKMHKKNIMSISLPAFLAMLACIGLLLICTTIAGSKATMEV